MVGCSEVALSPLNLRRLTSLYPSLYMYLIVFSFMTSSPLFLFRAHIPSALRPTVHIMGVSFLTAHAEERKEIQKRDQLFHSNNHHHFRRPATKAPNGSKLLSDGSLITGRDEVLAAWEKHFCELSASRSQSIPQMAEIVQKLPELRCVTRINSDVCMKI